jgi:hypothetical protein
MSAALTFDVLAALRTLHTIVVAMDLEDQSKRPTEDQYQAALAGAAAVLAKVPAQLAIADYAAYARAMRENDLYACIAIERRHGLQGFAPDAVVEGLSAAARGRDALPAVEAYLSAVRGAAGAFA